MPARRWQRELDQAVAAGGARRVTPMELLSAEHEAAMYQEHRAAEARVVGEIPAVVTVARRLSPRPDPDCTHPMLSALRSAGTVGDCATHYGYCPECADYFVVTEWANGGLESRPMTPAEQGTFAVTEDRIQRDEWIAELQDGEL